MTIGSYFSTPKPIVYLMNSIFVGMSLIAWSPILRDDFNLLQSQPPSISQLQITEGVVTQVTPKERIGKGTSYPKLVVVSSANARLYRCRFEVELKDCLPNALSLIGTTVAIGWYPQEYTNDDPLKPRGIYTLESEGKSIISYENTLQSLEQAKQEVLFEGAGGLIVMILFMWFMGKSIK